MQQRQQTATVPLHSSANAASVTTEAYLTGPEIEAVFKISTSHRLALDREGLPCLRVGEKAALPAKHRRSISQGAERTGRSIYIMTSGTEAETRQQLEEDLQREAEHLKQLSVIEDGLAAKQADRERLTAERAATHTQVTALKKAHDELEAHEHDGLTDGTETDPVAAATRIQASAALVHLYVGKLQRITETRLPLANQYVLVDEKKKAVLNLALAGDKLRIHNSRVLLAVLPAGEIGGDLIIKSEVAERLGHMEAQAAWDLQQASLALEAEIEQQQIDARASRGPGQLSESQLRRRVFQWIRTNSKH